MLGFVLMEFLLMAPSVNLFSNGDKEVRILEKLNLELELS